MYKLKNHLKDWYEPFSTFIVRNPLFPLELFYEWQTPAGTDVETAKNLLRESMRNFYRQPIAREALFIGSPDLHEQLLLWLDDKISKPDKRERTELSLVKYMIRMCSRCTPYGLFASCSHGGLADHTSIQLAEKFSIERFGRLDMDYSGQALTHLLNQPEISDQLKFFPNSSLYPLGENLRYIEHRFTLETGRSYHLVQIAQSVYLDKILTAAKAGGSPAELAKVITDSDISFEEASQFIRELILNQVLISELDPNVTGEEYFHILLKKLKTLEHTEKYITQFEKVISEFGQIRGLKNRSENVSDPEDKYEYYQNIVTHLRELEIPVHLKTLIQVDSYRPPLEATLNKRVTEELLGGASLLQILSSGNSSSDSFADFKRAFSDRYENQLIPLVEVLDTESGIGYGKFTTSGMEESPLIDRLPIGEGNNTGGMRQTSDAEQFKWKLYHDAILGNKTEVIIEDKTLEEFSKNEITSNGLPDSVYLMTRINASSAEDIDIGNYTVTVQSLAGPSGANLLGRFCHLHPDIEKVALSALQQEALHAPDCIYAEIIHLPESRVGNILMRPLLREYEIPYLCGSTVDNDFQIPVTDLMVGVQNNQVILLSKRLNKRIIPRMTNAHNFAMTTLPVYQFLCDLQYQGIKYFGWSWGVLESRSFLPRVRYGKFIISKARWLITKEEISECDKKSDSEIFDIFKGIVKSKNLPRYFLLSQGDNELILDSQNIFCIKLLLAEVNKYHTISLVETLDLQGKNWIKSTDGHYSGEFLFTLRKSIPVAPPVPAVSERKEPAKSVVRYFATGSEWLYVKIYCGTKTAERILCEAIRPLTELLLSEGVIDKFFFIRYHDTGNHIRIRFHHSTDREFWKKVLSDIHEMMEPFMANHSVYNVQIETYQREIERYGMDTIEQSEDIFYYQSKAILDFIALLDGDEGEQYRWQVALKAIDFFLDDFNYSLVQKRDLISTLHEGFSSEFNISGPQQKKISERFSSNKKLINHLMGNSWEEDENLKKALDIFKNAGAGFKSTIDSILASDSVQQDYERLNNFMGSYLHMFINRMFISNQRKVELVIYDYLLKIYETKIAIEKNQKAKNKTTEVSS